MAVDDLLGFDTEKYRQSLHSKYPTVAALQANEQRKTDQIAAAAGGALASYGLAVLIGPLAALGIGFSGRNGSIASQKRDLIRKELKERYGVGKTKMSGKTFRKNAAIGFAVKGITGGLGHGIENFCVPPGIDAAPHGLDAVAAAAAHPEHCLEGVKEGVMSELHAIHTLATTGSPDIAAQQAAMQLGFGTTGDNAYLAGAVIGDHAAREAEKGVAKLAVKGGSKLASYRLNNRSPTSKSTTEPTASKSASRRLSNLPAASKLTTKPLTSKLTTTAAVTTIPLKRRTRERKQQSQLALGKNHNNSIANWIIAACIIIPAVAIAFYAPSLFGIWLTILFKTSADFLATIVYALAISVVVILSFVGYLLGTIAKFTITTILPSVASVARYGLFESTNAVIGIFSFIGYLLAHVSSFVGHLLGTIAKFTLTTIFPSVASVARYGLFETAKAVIGIFSFIGYLLAHVSGFVVTIVTNYSQGLGLP